VLQDVARHAYLAFSTSNRQPKPSEGDDTKPNKAQTQDIFIGHNVRDSSTMIDSPDQHPQEAQIRELEKKKQDRLPPLSSLRQPHNI
jgi:hypothetical protein